uniref:AlNc14C10G1234 protein n=1 Tax=Albugo laibachii Nc14 TaxID=890382 RepID=F0W2I7_9STRA|nr:AlNc14C10G1234 [Albugo laibachii Nc14]|eukprot:CCA15273.1 AlNc14C10G1234 [Albugo laibachii Nc14]
MKVASDKNEGIKVNCDPSLLSERSNEDPTPTDSILPANDHSNMCTTPTLRKCLTESLRHWFDSDREKQTAVTDSAFEASKCASCRSTSIVYLLNTETVVETESGQVANYQDGTMQAIRPAESAILDTSLHDSLDIASVETHCGNKRSRRDLPTKAVAILKE